MDSLREHAVLVKFTNRFWSGGIVDDKASRDAETANNAETGTVRAWKRLVPKGLVEQHNLVAGRMRAFHIHNTLPWLDGGIRVLPAANFQDYMTTMRKLKAEGETVDRKIFAEYAALVKQGEKRLGKLWRAEEYPAVESLKEKFGFDLDVIPIPSTVDWRIKEIDAKVLEEQRRETEARFASLQASGIKELVAKLLKDVARAQKTLGDKDATFRDSLITNARETVALVAKLNVTGDKTLEALRKETETKLAQLNPEVLRGDADARGKATKDAAAIMKKMEAYMKGAKK